MRIVSWILTVAIWCIVGVQVYQLVFYDFPYTIIRTRLSASLSTIVTLGWAILITGVFRWIVPKKSGSRKFKMSMRRIRYMLRKR